MIIEIFSAGLRTRLILEQIIEFSIKRSCAAFLMGVIKEVLKETGRVELREGIIDKLIKEFCDSPYINQENYAETLYELIEIFYEYKNETMDLMTDDELISFMKKSFNGIAQGDLDYLSGTVMYKMRENLIKGKPLDYFEEGEEDE